MSQTPREIQLEVSNKILAVFASTEYIKKERTFYKLLGIKHPTDPDGE